MNPNQPESGAAVAAPRRGFLKQFASYFGVALIGLVVDVGLLILLHEVFHIHYLWAATGGFLGGLVVNYALSSKYVFSNPKIKSHTIQFLLFAAIGLIGLGLMTLLMWLMTSGVGINYIISKGFATIAVYMWNFFARRTLYRG